MNQSFSMEKAGGIGKKETQQNVSMQVVNLLQRFISPSNHFSLKNHENGEEIELSLGLSLNGRFGVDSRANKLTRSSSIPDFINNSTRKDTDESSPSSSPSLFPMGMAAASGSLVRTCSLPVETEEEWRKRKELQSLRRLEAKRKRCEKQKSLKALKDRIREEDKREDGCKMVVHRVQWVPKVVVPQGLNLKANNLKELINAPDQGALPVCNLPHRPSRNRTSSLERS